jgi:hypothetical protein
MRSNHRSRALSRRAALGTLLGVSLLAGGVAAFGKDPPSKAGYPPDPPGVSSRKQWVFSIGYRNKRPTIEKVRSVVLDQPISTARVIGRFALELHIGKELLDRVRFNVPLTGDGPEERRRQPFSSPTFEDVVTRITAQIADSPRATFLALVDRATGETQRFWWPPEPDGTLLPMAAPTSDAGVPKSDASRDGGKTK